MIKFLVTSSAGTGSITSGSGRARALGHSTGSGSGFRKQGSRAQISLAYYIKIQLFLTFKFRAWSGLVEI